MPKFSFKGVAHVPALQDIEIQAVFIIFHGNLHVFIKEVRLLHGVQKLHILDAAVQHSTAVRRDQTVREVVAAFHGTLQQSSGVLAQEAGHIIGSHFHGAGPGRPKTHRECPRKIQKRFRNIFTDRGDAFAALTLGLTHQIVVGVL